MKKTILFIFALSIFLAPKAEAASFEVSGWIPYWRSATGTQEALLHLDKLTEINPFGYTVKTTGQLVDTAKLDEEPWLTLFAAARAKKIKIIPTVMWGNGDAIDTVLRNPVLRQAEINDIVELVRKHNFDGIDIDYEAKSELTKDYFSTFLKDLYKAMGKKFVDCDIEARTPITSRYDTVPADYNPADVANDYVAINKYCDRVRIMTYDQTRVDVKLDEANSGPYAPVADPKWVEKVMVEAAKTISKSKLEIGIPTYGYEYTLTPSATFKSWSYSREWAFNPRYATDLAKSLNITPSRNSAGELSFIYSTGSEPRIVWWSDARAIADKVALAKRLGLRGVAVFKIDGGADPGMWNVLK